MSSHNPKIIIKDPKIRLTIRDIVPGDFFHFKEGLSDIYKAVEIVLDGKMRSRSMLRYVALESAKVFQTSDAYEVEVVRLRLMLVEFDVDAA